MVSAAEQLAANLNFGAFAKAEDLKRRIYFTLGALIVYRFGTFIPLPGVNPTAFAQTFSANASGPNAVTSFRSPIRQRGMNGPLN